MGEARDQVCGRGRDDEKLVIAGNLNMLDRTGQNFVG